MRNDVVRGSAKVTTYANGRIDVLACRTPIFTEPGYEDAFGSARDLEKARRVLENDRRPKQKRHGREPKDLARSMRRAKTKVREIALANDFDWFVTLTLDPQKVDRYDVGQVTRKLTAWCDNQARRHGLRYVLVPERHKDGALHFHGFMSWDGEAAPVTPSGTYTMKGWGKPRRPGSEAEEQAWLDAGAQVVFNLPTWTLGFTTAIAVYGEYGAAVSYVCKYVGKQMDGGKIGGRWYYSGGKLRKPEVHVVDISVDDLDKLPGSYAFTVPGSGEMRMWRGVGEELAALLGPVLEADSVDSFARTFYGEDVECGEAVIRYIQEQLDLKNRSFSDVSRETILDFDEKCDEMECDASSPKLNAVNNEDIQIFEIEKQLDFDCFT